MSNNINAYSLLVETSSGKAFLALNFNGTPIASQNLDGGSALSIEIYPALKKLLAASNLEIGSLNYISVGTGPGSYTGIRVGASLAKALSFSLKIPMVGFCSLKAFIPSKSTPFYSLIDAKTSGFFMLEGEKIGSQVIYKGHPQLISFEDAKLLFSKGFALVSPNIELLKERLSYLPEQLFFEMLPNAEHLAQMTYVKYVNKKFDLTQKLELLYLKEPNPVAL